MAWTILLFSCLLEIPLCSEEILLFDSEEWFLLHSFLFEIFCFVTRNISYFWRVCSTFRFVAREYRLLVAKNVFCYIHDCVRFLLC